MHMLSGKDMIAFILGALIVIGPLAAATMTRQADPQTVSKSGASPPNPPPATPAPQQQK